MHSWLSRLDSLRVAGFQIGSARLIESLEDFTAANELPAASLVTSSKFVDLLQMRK
jgi:hypothetical protein